MRLIRYTDLVAMGVVNSRMTLKRLIDLQGFPPGRLVSPNSRAWAEEEVERWILSRPSARKWGINKKLREEYAPKHPPRKPEDGRPSIEEVI